MQNTTVKKTPDKVTKYDLTCIVMAIILLHVLNSLKMTQLRNFTKK